MQSLIFAQTGEEESGVPILFMAFTGQDRTETEQLRSAMYTELEWIARSSGYTINQSRYAMKRPPSLNDLAAVDMILKPQYLINGIISRERNISVAEIELWNLENQSMLFSQAFEYQRLDEALFMVPFYVWSLYAILPVLEASAEEIEAIKLELEEARAEAEAAKNELEAFRTEIAAEGADSAETIGWKSRWFYLGLKGGISPRFYVFENNFFKDIGFAWEAALQAEFQFIRLPWGRQNMFFAVQGELLFTADQFSLTGTDSISTEKTLFSLMIPLLLKFNYKPGPFVLSPYGGMYYVHYFPSLSPIFGYSAGFKLGMKTWKRGGFFLDLRFSSDLGITNIDGTVPAAYRRTIPSISLGFELGLLDRN
jgi:hypothetical protein